MILSSVSERCCSTSCTEDKDICSVSQTCVDGGCVNGYVTWVERNAWIISTVTLAFLFVVTEYEGYAVDYSFRNVFGFQSCTAVGCIYLHPKSRSSIKYAHPRDPRLTEVLKKKPTKKEFKVIQPSNPGESDDSTVTNESPVFSVIGTPARGAGTPPTMISARSREAFAVAAAPTALNSPLMKKSLATLQLKRSLFKKSLSQKLLLNGGGGGNTTGGSNETIATELSSNSDPNLRLQSMNNNWGPYDNKANNCNVDERSSRLKHTNVEAQIVDVSSRTLMRPKPKFFKAEDRTNSLPNFVVEEVTRF